MKFIENINNGLHEIEWQAFGEYLKSIFKNGLIDFKQFMPSSFHYTLIGDLTEVEGIYNYQGIFETIENKQYFICIWYNGIEITGFEISTQK